MSLVDQALAASETPFVPENNVQKGAPAGSTSSVKHIKADKAAKAVGKLSEQAKAVAKAAWDRLRNIEAAEVTAVPGQQTEFVIPNWDKLPAEVQYVYAVGMTTDGRELKPEERYKAAKSTLLRVRGEIEADKVGGKVSTKAEAVRQAAREEGARASLISLLRKLETKPVGAERDVLVKRAQAAHRALVKADKDATLNEIREFYGADLADPKKVRTAAEAAADAVQVMPDKGQAAFLMDLLSRMLDKSELQTGGRLGFAAKLAEQLMTLYPEALNRIKVKYVADEGPKGKDGRAKLGNYNAPTNTVTLYKGGDNWNTIMHEIVHGLTVKAMADAKAKIAAGKKSAAGSAYENIQGLMEYVLKAHPELGTEYGFKSPEEFVAEVMSSSMFQAKLKGIKGYTGVHTVGGMLTDAFTALVKAIRAILGVRVTEANALTQAIGFSSALIDIQNAMSPEQQAEATAGMKTKKFDVFASPSSLTQSIAGTVGGMVRGADGFLAKIGSLNDLGGKVRRSALYFASTKQIQRWVNSANFPEPLHRAIERWFSADESKTRVMKVLTDLQNDHITAVQAALTKTGNYDKYNALLMKLAGEASGFNLDLSLDYAGNKARNKKLSDSAQMKAHVAELHREFMELKRNPATKALAELVKHGEVVNRQMYIMQSATLLSSALHAAVNAKAGAVDPAQATLNVFKDRLDVLTKPTGSATAVPGVHADGKTAELDAALKDAFKFIDKHFPDSDIYDSIMAIEKFYLAAVANPYMHLGRSGRFMVRFNVKDTSAETVAAINSVLAGQGKAVFPFAEGKDSVFMRFDTLAQMQQVHTLLKGKAFLKDGTLAAGAITDADTMDKAFAVSTAVDKLRNLMKAKYVGLDVQGQKDPAKAAGYQAAKQMLDSALIELMESSSARKMGARRENTLGYDLDYVRNFAKRGQAYVSTISNQYAAPKFADANIDMKEVIETAKLDQTSPLNAVKATEVYEELSMRHDNSMSPVDSPIVDAMRTFGYHFYLSLSPAFLITNMMQPYHLTLPYLGGRYGFVKAAKEMGRSSDKAYRIVKATVKEAYGENGWRGVLDAKLDLSTAGLSAGEKTFVEELVASGVVDFSQAHEIGRLAEGDNQTAATAAKALGIASHYSEVLNRISAGLAAYNLAGERVKAGKMSAEDQFRYAVETVNRTQYNYTDHNTARALGRHGFAGKLTPLFMSFQQYAFQTMEHYIQLVNEGYINKAVPAAQRAEARKALYGTLATTGAIAGVLGLPFAGVFVALSNAFGDDDDNRAELRSWLSATFGEDLGEIIARGGPRAAGIDLSSRAGHADLLPFTRWLADRRNFEDKMKDGSQTMMGPALNAAIDITAGMTKIADGDIAGGVEAALPMALKGVAKASRVASAGAYENKAGNAIPLPINSWDVLVQSFGFTPAKKAEQSEASFYHQSQQSLSKQSKATLKRDVVAAIESQDEAALAEAMAAVVMHNAGNPTAMLDTNDIMSTVEARMRGRAAAVSSGTGILDSNMNNLPRLGEYGWANTGIE